MKKIFILTSIGILLSLNNAMAVESLGGYAPGAFGKTERDQLRDLQIEQKLIEPVRKEESQKIEADVQKDVNIEGTIYNPQFKLEKINFEGNTKIKTKKLEKMAKKLEGKEIYLEDLLNFVLDVSHYYKKKGYVTSYAKIPPQEIKDGIVKVEIVESKVASVSIDGEKWTREWYLKNVILGASGLKEGDVFNAKRLQGGLKELNRQDYVQGVSTVSRVNDLTEIKLDVQDRFPVSFDVNWDNYGRDFTGTQRATMMLGMDNLTGFGDKIYGGTILSSGSTGIMAGYQLPVNAYGTKLSFDFSNSNVGLGGPYRDMKVKGQSQSFLIRLTHPFIRTAKSDLIGHVGFDWLHATTKMENPQAVISDYNLRVLRTGLYGMTDDKYGRWIGSVGFDAGFDGMGSTPMITGMPDSQFIKVTAGITRVQRLFEKSMGIIRVNGQYSPNKLYAAEQMQIGGPYTLRGYQPAELIGDYGIAGTVEYRFPIPFFGKILPEKAKFLDDKVKLAVFYDFGYVKENFNIYNYPQNFLHSVGVGTYINLTKWLSLQMGIGMPLGRKYYDENSVRFYFGLNSEVDKLIPNKPKERL